MANHDDEKTLRKAIEKLEKDLRFVSRASILALSHEENSGQGLGEILHKSPDGTLEGFLRSAREDLSEGRTSSARIKIEALSKFLFRDHYEVFIPI